MVMSFAAASSSSGYAFDDVPLAIVQQGAGDEPDDYGATLMMGGGADGEKDSKSGKRYDPCSDAMSSISLSVSSQRDGFMVAVYAFMDEYRLSIQLVGIGLGVLILWVVAGRCTPCVLVLLVVCMFFCLEYRLMNVILWACIIVLWVHGWHLGSESEGLSLSWKR